jgi:hypothetical protein
MVQIWRPGDNLCAFETLSKMVDLNLFFCSNEKRQSFCYPTIHAILTPTLQPIATYKISIDKKGLGSV